MKPNSRKGKSSKLALTAAYNDVKNQGMSVRAAAKKHSVPHSTLGDRVSGKISLDARDGKCPTLNTEDERKLINYDTERASKGIDFSKTNFLRYAGNLAMKRGTPFAGKNQMPSDRWWNLTKRRHKDFTLRKPENTAAIRHQMMTPNRVAAYFSSLKEELVCHNSLNCPSVIWNMDESYISLTTEPEKIVARKGAKYLHAKAGSRETITLIACGHANGTLLPPHLIFKGKTKVALRSWDTENAPSGAILSVSPTGWTKQGLALLWFTEVFLKNIGSKRPQILVFDGHDSHHHVEIINAARTINIILIKLPSHTSNWLQPLDRTFFGPLKSKWRKQIGTFTAQTACPVVHGNFFRLFSSVWLEMSSEPDKLINGFSATGICPFKPEAIPSDAFSPSTVYASAQETLTPSHCTQMNESLPESSKPMQSTPADKAHSESVAVGGEKSTTNVLQSSENLLGILSNSFDIDQMLETDPLLSLASVALIDLQCSVNDDGVLVQDSDDSGSVCPPELALAAIECSMTNSERKLFEDQLLGKKTHSLDNKKYETWKKFKLKVSPAEPESIEDPLIMALDMHDEDVLPNTSTECRRKEKEQIRLLCHNIRRGIQGQITSTKKKSLKNTETKTYKG